MEGDIGKFTNPEPPQPGPTPAERHRSPKTVATLTKRHKTAKEKREQTIEEIQAQILSITKDPAPAPPRHPMAQNMVDYLTKPPIPISVSDRFLPGRTTFRFRLDSANILVSTVHNPRHKHQEGIEQYDATHDKSTTLMLIERLSLALHPQQQKQEEDIYSGLDDYCPPI